MLTRFDHAVIGVRSLEAATAVWRESLGFDANPGGRHTGRGTYNAIVRFGLDYIELISIYDRGEVDARGEPNASALATLLDRAEGGLLGFALASDDIESDARRFRQAGLMVDGPTPMERLRPDGRLLRWRLLVPRGGSWGTPLPFIIQWDDPDAQRLSWEQPGTHANGAEAVQSLAITVSDLDRWVDVYSRQLGLQLIAHDAIDELGASRARFGVGGMHLDLISPSRPGPISGAVTRGEQPWQLTLACRDPSAASRLLHDHGIEPANTPDGLLIPPEAAMGARILLVRATSR